MSNFGFLRLRVVNAWEVAYAEARSAVNASAVLAQSQQYATVADAVADCSLVVGTTSIGHRVLEHPIRRLEYAGPALREALTVDRVALLFGSEKFGLSNEDMSYCHWLVRIPTREEHESMNLGQAVAVCLYEIIRREEAEHHEPLRIKSAESGDVERVATLFLDALRLSGYINKLTAESTEQKVRRLVNRLAMTEHDAVVLQGMVRQILWKLRQEADSPSVGM